MLLLNTKCCYCNDPQMLLGRLIQSYSLGKVQGQSSYSPVGKEGQGERTSTRVRLMWFFHTQYNSYILHGRRNSRIEEYHMRSRESVILTWQNGKGAMWSGTAACGKRVLAPISLRKFIPPIIH